MNLIENQSLKSFNTFGIDVSARYFASVTTADELKALILDEKYKSLERLVLGGGSNLLLTRDFPGLVLNICIEGKEVLSETETEVVLAVGAGENWHKLVMYCVKKGWGGIENLSLIPGKMGAAPMQNIGAYGIEIKEVFESLEALQIATGEVRSFSREECQFGYRESVFKRELKGKFIITRVILRLQKQPVLNTSYGAIEAELAEIPAENRTIRDVSEAVIRIRQSKLPDPAKIGNSGSFFKNPVISRTQFEKLKKQWPDMVSYPVSDTEVKVPAGWLIDRAGWKGRTLGAYGVHKKQALVLVNYGGAAGADIWQLSEDIKRDIQRVYGIDLEREVNVI